MPEQVEIEQELWEMSELQRGEPKIHMQIPLTSLDTF